jgi:hypothetical protein
MPKRSEHGLNPFLLWPSFSNQQQRIVAFFVSNSLGGPEEKAKGIEGGRMEGGVGN